MAEIEEDRTKVAPLKRATRNGLGVSKRARRPSRSISLSNEHAFPQAATTRRRKEISDDDERSKKEYSDANEYTDTELPVDDRNIGDDFDVEGPADNNNEPISPSPRPRKVRPIPKVREEPMLIQTPALKPQAAKYRPALPIKSPAEAIVSHKRRGSDSVSQSLSSGAPLDPPSAGGSNKRQCTLARTRAASNPLINPKFLPKSQCRLLPIQQSM